MANLNKCKPKIQGCKCPKKAAPLDTLAQLRTDTSEGRNKFIKRQKAKAITMGQIFPLIDLDSRLKKAYWRSYHCNRLILQEGYKMTTKYCNGRWCTVCNRIRMAKMINAYSVPLMKLEDLYFVTLTTPNVQATELDTEIDGMYKSWRAVNHNMRKTYTLDIKGMRKLECTYNPITDSYNPHFHIIINGKESASKLIELWLKRYPKASRKAQDMRKAKEGSLIELFKYTVKGVHKGKYYPQALDQIYQALEGRRTYQPFGISKIVDEDIDGIRSEDVTFKGFKDNQWKWSNNAKDWVNQDAELLTEYILDGKLSDWIDDLTESVGKVVEPDREQPSIRLNKREFQDSLWTYYSRTTDELINSS